MLDKKVLRSKKPIERARYIAENLHSGITKEAYERGMNLSRYLEKLDPTTGFDNPYVVGDAFQRALASCGIRLEADPVRGISASRLEDVVKHPKAQHLAVELIARSYRGAANPNTRSPNLMSTQGIPGQMINQFAYAGPRGIPLEPAIPLSEIVGQTTGISEQVYKPFYINDVGTVTARVGEAAEIPAVKITTKENVIQLQKFGRRLDYTYESMRRIPIDLLAQTVRRIAIKIETEKVSKALGVIVSGDGNTGSTPTSYTLTSLDSGTTANNLTLKAWLAFKMKFQNPFIMTTVLAQSDSALKVMLLSTGTANLPMVLWSGVVGAQGVTPINQTLSGGERIGWLTDAPAGKLVGFDKRFAVERVFEIGGTIQESDRDVKSQLNSLVLSEIEGYSIMEGGNATKILDMTA